MFRFFTGEQDIVQNIFDCVLKIWRRDCRGMGIPVYGDSLFTLHFADDQVTMAEIEDDA